MLRGGQLENIVFVELFRKKDNSTDTVFSQHALRKIHFCSFFRNNSPNAIFPQHPFRNSHFFRFFDTIHRIQCFLEHRLRNICCLFFNRTPQRCFHNTTPQHSLFLFFRNNSSDTMFTQHPLRNSHFSLFFNTIQDFEWFLEENFDFSSLSSLKIVQHPMLCLNVEI